jgi:hypothetical protein
MAQKQSSSKAMLRVKFLSHAITCGQAGQALIEHFLRVRPRPLDGLARRKRSI